MNNFGRPDAAGAMGGAAGTIGTWRSCASISHGAQSARGAMTWRVSGSGYRGLGIKPGKLVGLARVGAVRDQVSSRIL